MSPMRAGPGFTHFRPRRIKRSNRRAARGGVVNESALEAER
jgi:hypothetical protein